MNVREWIEIACALTILAVPVGVVIQRCIVAKGTGVRSIQFVAAATVIPAVLILGLEGLMDGNGLAALVGAFVGYLFSNIADFDRRTID